jgi:hypothetical protein
VITVMLPSRGRTGLLRASIGSLAGLAARPDKLEILVAADPDDEPTVHFEAGDGRYRLRVITAPERFGYARLHEYYNLLATHARGTWLMLWNDDASMLTPGWDEVVRAQPDSILWAKANHCEAGLLFPVWPRSWYEIAGYVSRSPNVDVWLQDIGNLVCGIRPVDIRVFHDRFDVTGRNGDSTYAEGRALQGGDVNHPSHGTLENIAERERVAALIRAKYATAAGI